MLESLLEIDKQLFLFLNGLGNTHWDGFWMLMTNKFVSVPVYIFLLYFIYKRQGLKNMLIVVLLMVVAITISDQLSQLFKYGFERLRPCHEPTLADLVRLVKSSCGGKYSYFSAHASTSMTLAVFLGLTFKSIQKNTIYFLLLFAFLIAYSRVYIGVHYPLDIITGMFFGVLIGSFVNYLRVRFTVKK